MTTGLLTAGAGHPWETELVAALDSPAAPLTVVRRCADIADVLATASTGQASACVLAADLRRLDSESVQRLTAAGIAVVVVHPAGDLRAPARLQRIGVSETVADDAGSQGIIAAVQEALAGGVTGTGAPGAPRATGSQRAAGTPRPAGTARPGPRGTSDPRWALAPRSAPADDDGDRQAGTAAAFAHPDVADDQHTGPAAGGASTVGTVVAVWGPVGAPGRSTVAMGVADEAAGDGRTVLLIDADVYGGVLANAFGLLDESPGLAGACRLAANGRLDAAELTRLCWAVGDGLAVLTGIARADRWPEVRPSAIPAVLAVARGLADLVVVDCSAIIESDEELSFDTMAPRRNGATLAVLDDADVVLAVGSGDPPGMERLVRGMAELAEAVGSVTPQVVLNRVRRTAASEGELAAAVRRFAGAGVRAMLPEDRAACDRAWQRGVTLSTAAPGSPLRTALAALAAGLLPTRAGDRVAVSR